MEINFVEKADRTFETRLQFIKSVFSDRYDQSEMLKSCITYKLNISFEDYMETVRLSLLNLQEKNPLTILKRA